MTRVAQRRWTFDLAEEFGHCDVTGEVERLVRESGVATGMVAVAVVGSTGVESFLNSIFSSFHVLP